jgi:autotransporter adhesin
VNNAGDVTYTGDITNGDHITNKTYVDQAAAAAKTTVIQGDNIVVTPTTNADGSTTYQVATAKDVTFDSVIVGSVSIDKNNVDAAGKTIISGLGKGEVSATSTDAINGSQLYSLGTGVQNIIGGNTTYDPTTGTYVNNNIGNTGKNNINDAIASVNDAATKAKTTVTAGSNVVVTPTTNADGSSNYEVAVANDLNVNSVTSNVVTVGSVNIDKTHVDDAGKTIISGVGKGELSSTSTDAVNGSQLYATNQKVTQNTTDITNINTTLDKGLNFSADSGDTVNRKLGDTVAITGDSNITTTTTANGVQVKLSDSIDVKNVNVSQNFTVSEGANVNMGGNVIQNVGAGVADTDAVNVGQLKNVANHIGKVEDKLSGGIAASAALAVVTPVEPGTYHLSGGAAYYNGGYGVGFNLLKRSDNGRTTMHAGVGWGSGGGGALVRVGAGFSFGGN